MTGMELARRAGVSPSYVSLIEHGEKIPSEDVAVRIARSLGEREDLYRVWAATSRMDERTRQAVLRLRGTEPELQRLARGDESEPGEGAGPPADEELRDSSLSVAPDTRRPPGRPRVPDRYEFQVAYRLDDETHAAVLRIPLLVPGSVPDQDPPPAEQVEALVALDARLLDRPSAEGLVALRIDENNGRDAVSWLRPRDLVVIERGPQSFDPALLHAFRVEDGLRVARGSITSGVLLVLPDPSQQDPPRAIRLDDPDDLSGVLYGTVLWSARLWPL
ncbi:MAG: helix-turn-helix transcriptional regulator [Acidobacteria bacterium]|nr:helix-turn-helix transcriptional regulator [Acidobacteriota bacterium]